MDGACGAQNVFAMGRGVVAIGWEHTRNGGGSMEQWRALGVVGTDVVQLALRQHVDGQLMPLLQVIRSRECN